MSDEIVNKVKDKLAKNSKYTEKEAKITYKHIDRALKAVQVELDDDSSPSVHAFAIAIAKVLKEYGTHNFAEFKKTLNKNL